jgi:DNA-binding CsgD family transcriptional regulator
MERLRNRELRGLVEFLMDGQGVGDLDAFVRHLLRALPKLVPCAVVSYNEINTRLGRVNWIAKPDEVTRFPGCEEILGAHIGEHPIVIETMRTGRAEWARWSDLLTRRQLASMPLYQEFFRRIETHHQIGILYPNRDGVSIGVALNRDVEDFSDRERLLLNVLRPHIRGAYDQAEAFTLAKYQIAALEQGVDAIGFGLLALRPDGRLAFATGTARRWLETYFGWKAAGPAPLRPLVEWLQAQKVDYSPPSEIPAPSRPLVVRRGDRMLSVRLMRDGGQDVLLMRETVRSVPARPLKARGLSDREAEVLGWVMEGKTNPEIATILGLSRRTVHHHLENIYRKLGVETRTAAAKMARELAEAVAEEHG